MFTSVPCYNYDVSIGTFISSVLGFNLWLVFVKDYVFVAEWLVRETYIFYVTVVSSPSMKLSVYFGPKFL